MANLPRPFPRTRLKCNAFDCVCVCVWRVSRLGKGNKESPLRSLLHYSADFLKRFQSRLSEEIDTVAAAVNISSFSLFLFFLKWNQMWKSLSALLYTAVGVVVRAAPIHGDSADWAGALGECYKVGLYTVYTSTVRKFITQIFWPTRRILISQWLSLKLIFRLICLVHKSPFFSYTFSNIRFKGGKKKKIFFLGFGWHYALLVSLCVCVCVRCLYYWRGYFFLPRAYQHGNSGNPSKMMESFACRNHTRRND